MKKYVFTVRDDVCIANGKDAEATELLAKMKLYGTVEDYDRATATMKAEYQANIDNLSIQLSAIKDQELTADELDVVLNYRANKAKISEGFLNRIGELEGELVEIKNEDMIRAEKILALFNKEA